MNETQRKNVERQALEANARGFYQWAAYLELCLKLNEAPR